MHSDDVVWKIINRGFCSFKVKTLTSNFCRHEYNVNGHCSRATCPLANSRYATVREKDGLCYLCVKTAERQHLPNQLWEEIPLSKNLEQAFAQIDEELKYWKPFTIHKCKQRLVKISQYLIRMRKIRKTPQRSMHRIHKKVERRERTREERAEKVAQIDNKIKAELLERLKQGTYGGIYNFNTEVWNKALDEGEEVEQEEEGLGGMFLADDYEDDSDEEQDKSEEEERFATFGGISSGEDSEEYSDDLDDFSESDEDDDGGEDSEFTDGNFEKESDGFGSDDDSDFEDLEDVAKLFEGGDSTIFDVNNKGTEQIDKKIKPPKGNKQPVQTKKRQLSGGKSRAAKKSHIDIQYEDTPEKEKEQW